MESLFTGALSARQEPTNQITSRIFSITKLGPLTMALALLLAGCNGKTNGQHTADAKKNVPDSLHKPKVDIKVNRRYDDKGNQIGFDSTYTSYYSNLTGDTTKMDSLMKSFDSYFRNGHSAFFYKKFDPLFFDDSTRYPDFFHNDFFMRRYELNDPYLRDMMQDMDSIKNKFYKDHRQVRGKSKT
jgi:hypothetical protein